MAEENVQASEKSEGREVGKIILAICVSLMALFLGLMFLEITNPELLPGGWIPYLVFGVLSFTGPYGFYSSSQIKKIKQIEAHLPDFLRDVAEAGRFGMTLADAMIVASSGRYGKLTPEIRKMAAQIEWGVPVSESLRLFRERVDTQLVNRIVAIVIKSNDAGGNVADVLSMVAHDAKETQLMQKERKIEMSTYVMVIYIAFVVFLVTIIIMGKTFLPQMTKAGESLGAVTEASGLDAGGGAVQIQVDVIEKITVVFLMAAIIHAIGDGLIAGVLEDGRVTGGLKHSFIMTLIAFLMLTLML